ncbi:pyruvate dehydrogenase [Candidatus Heimdallarchaeota archaeon B3_Heim]|nr:MAG: pyruvate dehydrogenase [Candidatus Heimdallarchaeota archaeon B3_Heim]
MRKMSFADAIESALKQAMSEDPNVFLMGEDLHTFRVNILAQFGNERVQSTPISESAFLGAGVTAAMAGLRPVVEIMLIDFIGVAIDALLNHASKVYSFSGGKWNVPLVVRASCGGGYGDGGQHEQSLWGWLAHIPGLNVVVPSNPADAGQLMLSAIEADHPVIYLEHKLLADYWLDYMGTGGRENVNFDVPQAGVQGLVPEKWEPLPVGKAICLREGSDLTFISLGVSVHRCMEAAEILAKEDFSTEVIDLRWVSPLDTRTIIKSASKTKRVIVVDEDYLQFGLSGEIAAILAEENGLKCQFGRIGTETTIPYNRHMEDNILPNVKRILELARKL